MQVPQRLPGISSICNCLYINSTFSEDATCNNFHTRQRSSGSCQPPKVTALSSEQPRYKQETRQRKMKSSSCVTPNHPPHARGLGSPSGRHSWYGMSAPHVCTSCLQMSKIKGHDPITINSLPRTSLPEQLGRQKGSKCAKCLATNYSVPKAARKTHRQPGAAGTGSRGGGSAYKAAGIRRKRGHSK